MIDDAWRLAQCEGKHKHHSREDAIRCSALGRGKRIGPVGPFRCNVCGSWHLGNSPKRKGGKVAKGAGRKKKQGERYPSGKLKPDVMETALEARMRIFGVSRDRAKRQETGTAIGRAYDNRDEHNVRLISKLQLDALQEWDKAVHDMKTATDAKRMRSASDYSGAGGYDGNDGTDESYMRFCSRAIERYKRLRKAILDSGPLGHMAVQTWVECDNYDLRCLGDLRLAANAIRRAMKGQ